MLVFNLKKFGMFYVLVEKILGGFFGIFWNLVFMIRKFVICFKWYFGGILKRIYGKFVLG